MTGLLSRYGCRWGKVSILCRLFGAFVILFTTTVILKDRLVRVRKSLEKNVQVSNARISSDPYDVTQVKRKEVISSKSNSGMDDRIAPVAEIEQKIANSVNLPSNNQNKGKRHYKKNKGRPKHAPLWADENSLEIFNTSITLEEKFGFRELLKTFVKTAEKNKLEYFLCCGSLLGSYRHHGMTPWDDDIDVMMNSSHMEAIKSAFQFPSALSLDTSPFIGWKVYFNYSNPIDGRSWKWPFLDLILFTENSTHIWVINPRYLSLPKSSIYPTVYRPFWDLWLPAPRDTERILKRQFDLNVCVSLKYNHRLERPNNYYQYRKIPCKSLNGVVPFVRRQTLNDSYIIETLYIGNRTLGGVVLKKP